MSGTDRATLVADLNRAAPADLSSTVFVDAYFTSTAAARLGEGLCWIRWQDGCYLLTGDGRRALEAIRG